MRYTFPMIIECLEQEQFLQFAEYRCGVSRQLSGVTADPGDAAAGGLLLVTDAANLPDRETAAGIGCVLFLGGETLPAVFSGCSCAAVLPGDEWTVLRMLSAVGRILSRIHGWCSDMENIVRDGKGFYELLDRGHALFRNPMIVYDTTMKLLAFTRNDGNRDRTWQDVAGGGARIRSKRDSEELRIFLEKVEQAEGPFVHKAAFMTDPFYTAVVKSQNTRVGMVTEMELHHTIRRGELDLLEVFCGYVALLIRQKEELQRRTSAMDISIVEDLISGRVESREQLSLRLLAAGWIPARFCRVLQFAPTVPYVSEAALKTIYRKFQDQTAAWKGCISPKQKTGLFFLMKSDTEAFPEQMLQTVRQLCRENHMRCAVSDCYENLVDTVRYARQTDAVLELTKQELGFYEDCRFRKLVQNLVELPHYTDMLHPAVLKLRELDRTTGSDYMETLKEYVRSGYRQVDTAAVLRIHRTTLLYRLGKMQELTGLDLADPEQRLHAAITLAVLTER